MNFSDSERISSCLTSNNFTSSPSREGADLIVFNTCGVRQTAEDRVYGQIHNIRKNYSKAIIVVTGCLAHRKDVQNKLDSKVDYFIPINEIQSIIEKIASKRKTDRFPCKHYLDLLPSYKDHKSILVPIMTGCNNFCSYCVVPYARGREWSRPVQDIKKEIGRASKSGCKEIMLLGQNVNSYKYNRIDFSQLLADLAGSFPVIIFTFLTSHPKDFSDKLVKVIKNHNNISRKIHLPVQSGSDKILKKMNRNYSQKHYLKIIKKIRNEIPNAVISTDVIVGFPGETEADFQKTVEVFKKANFFESYINKYSPRPGTAAHKLGDPISWKEKKKRERILRSIVDQTKQ